MNQVQVLIAAVEDGKKTIVGKSGTHDISGFTVKSDEYGSRLCFKGFVRKMPTSANLTLKNDNKTKYGLAEVEHDVPMFKSAIKNAQVWENSMKNWSDGDEIMIEVSETMTDGKINCKLGFAGDSRAVFDEFEVVREDIKTPTTVIGG